MVTTTLLASVALGAQKLPVIVQVPADSPTDASVFLAGSLPSVGNWKADGVQLARAADGTYSGDLMIDATGQRLEYKFTRGTWDTVEKAADGSERSNRAVTLDASTRLITATVERWASEPAKASTVVGTLQIVPVPASDAHAARTIRVWLPPGYDTDAATRFPVLYLQDGQNCFDRATSAYGSEWQVDETLTRLIADGIVPPMIVVGIDNAGANRIKEYTFAADLQDGGGEGAAYADLFLHGIMPFVAQRYRVKAGPASTFIGGSSLGALVSLEIARRHPGTFGGVLVMSPALWWDNQTTIDELEKDASGLVGTRVWIDIGTREVVPLAEAGSLDPQNQRAVEEARWLDTALRRAGIEDRLTVEEGAQHNEVAWAKRFPSAIAYLFGPR